MQTLIFLKNYFLQRPCMIPDSFPSRPVYSDSRSILEITKLLWEGGQKTSDLNLIPSRIKSPRVIDFIIEHDLTYEL